ncbi:hypothetical protein [Propionicimonas sp.]|uniref:hypothetical protein n=1 Tax=Propionicimonas sp. TaxID=1955623 RepID=UPI0017FCAB88|nr:hypothetical protein [Propionicimonas sp.]MBU3976506.1 hypothetical protein [Actinomycetota bacterium]MBA3020346.1 hypothetical protein [Propionicimonas sp.]MBU3987338.1 hypothetical protein [Actinomycetota bacterium]MBU4007650.1 hypothetical protein [Actinomycetota bacterium]MBU4064431.1 hypothetical protein [Actinomycetota bacterium]
MTPLLIDFLIALQGSSGDSGWVLLAGPAGAAGTYWGLYQYYRNTGKSHDFEHNTIIESDTITGGEQKVDHVQGTQRTTINGDNVSNYRQRVKRV